MGCVMQIRVYFWEDRSYTMARSSEFRSSLGVSDHLFQDVFSGFFTYFERLAFITYRYRFVGGVFPVTFILCDALAIQLIDTVFLISFWLNLKYYRPAQIIRQGRGPRLISFAYTSAAQCSAGKVVSGGRSIKT